MINTLGKLGACQIVVSLLRTHTLNDYVVPECALAIDDLSIDHEDNKVFEVYYY
jgi:hypothetical protein